MNADTRRSDNRLFHPLPALSVSKGSSALICGLFLLAGCSGYSGPQSVANEDPAVKIPQIRRAVDARDRSVIPQLVRDLDSNDGAVRFYAIDGLRRLTGETFDYDWKIADRHARRDSINRWKAYIGEPVETPATTQSAS